MPKGCLMVIADHLDLGHGQQTEVIALSAHIFSRPGVAMAEGCSTNTIVNNLLCHPFFSFSFLYLKG